MLPRATWTGLAVHSLLLFVSLSLGWPLLAQMTPSAPAAAPGLAQEESLVSTAGVAALEPMDRRTLRRVAALERPE